MSDPQFNIVFKGEILFGFEVVEVRAKLKRLCKYDETTLDKLFSGQPVVIKSRLTGEVAKKYKAALDQTGADCSIVEIPGEEELPAQESSPARIECPKCNQEQPAGETCLHCGIVFAKFQKIQERQTAGASGEVSPGGHVERTPSTAGTAETDEGGLGAYFANHQEQAFILKAFLTIAAIIFVKEFLSGLLTLFILLFPVLFLIYVRLEAGSTDRPPAEVLAQHITFMPVMYADGERKKEGVAWVTYGLIFVNILVFYGYEIHVNPNIILHNLIFIPYSPTTLNIPLSLITSLFLHAGAGHLWGNMLFLWAVGTVVERRIGAAKFIIFYFAAGVSACLVTAFVEYAFFGRPPHLLGASGAIAGVMGLFAVRCYFKSMVFPLPILGIFSLILPINLKVRLNSLVIIGLFFLADLSGGISQVAGQSQSNIGHWAHIGGMVCGILLGMMFKLGDQAVEERHLEIGNQALSKRGDLYQGEESLRLALEKNPNNFEAMLLLARLLSKFQPTEEAEDLYLRSMDMQINTKPQLVAEAFKEYYDRYLKGAAPRTMYRLASFYHQQKDFDWAARCLELLSDDKNTPPSLREKAMFQCARQMEYIGKFDVAMHYYQMFLETFPQSVFCEKAKARLQDA